MIKLHRAVFWVLLFILAASFSGNAFTIDEILDNGTSSDPSDDLQDAARWSDLRGTFVEDNVRGLGGGLEYAISSDFFDRILPSFIGAVPTRDQLSQAIQRAFGRWASGSPLTFTDVSSQIFAIRDAAYPGSGSEIDLFAVPDGDLAFRHNTLAGNTFITFGGEEPMGTNGQRLSGRTISSADILINTDAKYYMDPNDPAVQSALSSGQFLVHFESLVQHEISHAIGLDHPDEFPERNFDTDTSPSTPMSINCQSPTQGLILSPNIDRNAVATSAGSGGYRLNLTADDLGGRAFLYPRCGGSSTPTPTPTPTPSPTPTPPPSNGAGGLQQFDTNQNCKLEDGEFFTLVDQWIGGSADNSLFFEGVDAWIDQSDICSAAAAVRLRAEPQIGLRLNAHSNLALFAVESQNLVQSSVEIFDLNGRLVSKLKSGGNRLVWPLTNLSGRRVSSGVYLYRISTLGSDGHIWTSSINKISLSINQFR